MVPLLATNERKAVPLRISERRSRKQRVNSAFSCFFLRYARYTDYQRSFDTPWGNTLKEGGGVS